MWPYRSTEEMFLSVGARIGYFQGDVKKLVDDIATLRPTLFIGAPRTTFTLTLSGHLTITILMRSEAYVLCDIEQGVVNPRATCVCLLRRGSPDYQSDSRQWPNC